ncbi:MAG: hypothetical protein FJZ90_12350 [Chloroflexi bacterium]|nr:hypothetical protein [Chloroflexota bacterium]
MASLLALEGIEVSFEQAQRKVAKTLLLEVSANTVRQATQEFGALQEAEEKRWIEESHDGYDLLARRRESSAPPQRLYGSLDGVPVPVGAEWPELKGLCWYRTEERAGRRGVGETGALRATEISYPCDRSDALDVRDLVWASGCQRGADRAAELVFVADGAAWIWHIVRYHFPQAVQIVDGYHAVQYLQAIAQAAYAVDDPEGSRWLERAREQLWEGESDAVIVSCGQHADHRTAATAVHKAITCFTNNRRRMGYRRFREQGYPIGSGVVESACQQIGALRLKRPGTRWGKQGARYTAKARGAWLSGAWQTLEFRAQQLAQAA